MAEVREQVIVLANRAPVRHERSNGEIVATRSASGLVTALEPLLEAYSGTWVAHAAGSADTDVVDARGGIDVPLANHRYRVRYVAMPAREHRGYYCGFANEGLWPLCHSVDVRPVFRRDDYEMYRAANTRFATVVADESRRQSPIILVQDYHFTLAPRLIRRRLPHSTIVTFWHIPFPRSRTLRTCPWSDELLAGLLGSDIIGFQTDDDCRNFLNCVEALPDVTVDVQEGIIEHAGGVTTVRTYPVGVDCAHDALRATPPEAVCRQQVRDALALPANVRIGVGIDRLDYTKGINEKFLAVERLLENEPELPGKFAFVQVAEPSRDCLDAYRAARAQIVATAERINARFSTSTVQPIRLIEQHHQPADVYRFYRAADFCHVGSLHDGMNLVAKEFVSARRDSGVLILSEFAGAARQLRSALIVNPLRIDQSAQAMAQALRMPAIEQAMRMRILNANVEACDAAWWANAIVNDASRCRSAIRTRSRQWTPAVA